jgi:hypothetical protein
MLMEAAFFFLYLFMTIFVNTESATKLGIFSTKKLFVLVPHVPERMFFINELYTFLTLDVELSPWVFFRLTRCSLFSPAG